MQINTVGAPNLFANPHPYRTLQFFRPKIRRFFADKSQKRDPFFK